MSKKGFTSIALLLLGLTLASFVLIGVIVLNRQPNSTNSTSSATSQKAETQYPNFFVKQITNFDNLTLDDLPHAQKIRKVESYKDDLIILNSDGKSIGSFQAIKYNPKTKTLVGMNDKRHYEVISDAVFYSNYMYVLTRKLLSIHPTLYKVNLDNDAVEKLIKFENKDPHFSASLKSEDGNIWVTTWSATYKINPSDDSYTVSSLQNSEDKETNAKDEDEKQVAQTTKNYGIDLPLYFSISNLVNNKYYLASANGLYILERGKLPEKHAGLDFNWALNSEGELANAHWVNGKFLVTPNEKYASMFIIGSCLSQDKNDNSCDYPLTILLIDLNTLKTTNIKDPNRSIFSNNFDKLKNTKIEENNQQLEFKDATSNQEVAILDFASKTFQLSN